MIVGYELLEEIGHGGMGVVHKVRNLAANRIEAVKTIRAGAFAKPKELAQFRLPGPCGLPQHK